VLKRLSLRKKEKQRKVFLAEFDHLDILNVDKWVIIVLRADLQKSDGMFFCQKGNNGLIKCYIVLKYSLYNEAVLERVKIVGVHEFCHFMAMLYLLTAITDESQRDGILKRRLVGKIDDLNTEALNRFFGALNEKEYAEIIPELTDEHYRLEGDGDTVKYDELFKHLMFSKELFDEYFVQEEQERFRILMNDDKENKNIQGVELYREIVSRTAKDKSVPLKLAWEQALLWVKKYLI
jgi:hypothetical protein